MGGALRIGRRVIQLYERIWSCQRMPGQKIRRRRMREMQTYRLSIVTVRSDFLHDSLFPNCIA
ncbi:hypothetical protein M3J09_009377 [Ascochyta lentis]